MGSEYLQTLRLLVVTVPVRRRGSAMLPVAESPMRLQLAHASVPGAMPRDLSMPVSTTGPTES